MIGTCVHFQHSQDENGWMDGCGGVAWCLGLAGWVSAGSRSQPEQLSISNYFPINHCSGIAMPPGQPVKTIIVSYFQSSFQSLFCLPPMIGTCVHFQQPQAENGWLAAGVWPGGWDSLGGCSMGHGVAARCRGREQPKQPLQNHGEATSLWKQSSFPTSNHRSNHCFACHR